jgi:hypothetical protein
LLAEKFVTADPVFDLRKSLNKKRFLLGGSMKRFVGFLKFEDFAAGN